MSEPYSEQLPPFVPRVAVKLDNAKQLPEYADQAEDLLSDQDRKRWDELLQRFPGITLERQFTSLTPGQLLELMRKAASAQPGVKPPNLLTHYAIQCRNFDPAFLVKELRAWDLFEAVYDEGPPVAPPAVTLNDPRRTLQGYVSPAPTTANALYGGVNALYAWANIDPGGAGETLQFIDIEQGWQLGHEDLPSPAMPLDGDNHWYFDHGTSALGVVSAVDNSVGIIGIACNASARVVSEWRLPTDTNRKTADAITLAANLLQPGDVLLLESQYEPSPKSRQPSEVQRAVYDAIRTATDNGIVVIEPAANGGVDLGQIVVIENQRWMRVLNPEDADFRDSGAIIVGAASSRTRKRRVESNFGTRVDCFAWGDNVDTLLASSTSAYTDSIPKFSGTSSAAAIVAGVALIVQSATVHLSGNRLNPSELRALLSTKGTPSQNPTVDLIGIMPDLLKLLT